MADQLLSLAAAANRCGVSERTLHGQVANPHSGLRASRIGRCRLPDEP
jgi:hypothetical protein